MNLNSVSDWSFDHVFLDVFKKARPWCTQNADDSGSWNTKFYDDIPRDANGWPTQVPFVPATSDFPQTVHTLVTVVKGGTYTLTYEGMGNFTIKGSGGALNIIESDTQGIKTFSFDVTMDEEQTGTIWLEILSTDSSDYLRNFKIMTPGYISDESNPFHPEYKTRLTNFSVLRFMDWGRTNASPVVTWNDRTQPGDYTQAGNNGVALEYMVMLANDLEKDLWICIPHQADDNYISQCAQLLKNTVGPDIKIYVEYSNETWNCSSSFSQTLWVQDKGVALGLDGDRWKAGQKYAGVRSAEIWRLFQEVFGADMHTRIVKVLATQSANSGISEMRLDIFSDPQLNPDGIQPDALAMAPYFGGDVADDIVDRQEVDSISVTDILSRAQEDIELTLPDEITAQKALAMAHNLELICYEGGQHLVGTLGNENNDILTGKLLAANRSLEMGALYTQYLTLLQTKGVSHFNNFSYIGAYNKWGSWGVFEHLFQASDTSPKFQILNTWIDENPPPPEEPEPVVGPPTLVTSRLTGVSPALNTPWDLTDELYPNIIYHGWTLGSGVTPLGDDDAMVFSLCNKKKLTSLSTAVKENQYAAVSLEPAVGWTMDLGGAAVTLTIRRMDNHGGHQYAVFSSVDGFKNGDEIFVSDYYDFWSVKDVVLSFNLPREGYTAIDNAIEFRVYPFDAQYCGKKLGISGFTLEGTLY
ncbi:hypothetical protein [Desulfocicer vacuolatum]|nr:hypothetical protein [Desulfocicer vacuolatum]